MTAGTAKELVRNLRSQTNETSPDNAERAAEASYQLAIAYFEGIGTTKDVEESLSWLTKAALKESLKAIAAISNLYASLDRPMPQDAITARSKCLAKVAQHELLRAYTDLYGNNIIYAGELTALQQWVNERPSEYQEYLASSELRTLKTLGVSIWLLHRDLPTPNN